MLQPFSFDSPRTLEEACQALSESGGRLISGGTDVVPQMRDGRFQAGHLIDLSRLDNLRGIDVDENRIVIGGLTNYCMMIDSTLLQNEAAALVEAAGMVGGVQTRTRGTLAGNIANASPAGDTLPPLLVLDADVLLVSLDDERMIPLEMFLLGPGKTAIFPNEIIRAISFERLPAGTKSTFMRLGNRRGMAISVVSAAAVLRLGKDKRVEEVRLALGAVAPTAVRCYESEAILLGKELSDALIEEAANLAVQACAPIDDVRGTADFRRHGVKALVRRCLHTLAR